MVYGRGAGCRLLGAVLHLLQYKNTTDSDCVRVSALTFLQVPRHTMKPCIARLCVCGWGAQQLVRRDYPCLEALAQLSSARDGARVLTRLIVDEQSDSTDKGKLVCGCQPLIHPAAAAASR